MFNKSIKDNLLEILSRENIFIEKLINTDNYAEHFFRINNIIEVKNQLNYINENLSLYSDLKTLVKLYFTKLESSSYGYDTFRLDLIISKIKYTPTSQQIELLFFLKRLLIDNEYFELIRDCEKEINKAKLENYKSTFSYTKPKTYINVLKMILLWSSLSIFNLLFSLAIMYVLSFIVFLPAPYGFMEVFKVQYINFSDNYLSNHALNLLSFLFDLSNKMIITSNCWYGLLGIILGKILYIILIINFVLKEFIKAIKMP